MANGLRGSSLLLIALGVGVCASIACSEDPADSLSDRRNGRGASQTGAPGADGVDPNDPTNPNRLPAEEAKFRAVEPALVKSCGNTCHDLGTFNMPAPTFLAGPDAYKSIKAHPGIVVRDVYTSLLLTKGTHAGPALKQDPEVEKKVTEWLEAEAILIKSQRPPTTPSFTVISGPNDVDLTPACTGGITGVHLKFDAALVGTSLSLSKITISVPAGKDVHILQPRFVRVLAKAREDGSTDVADPADSFSNSDQTIGAGKEVPLAPGAALFSNDTWRPFDLANDKLRIEVAKLEPGSLSAAAPAATCKDPAGFAQNVLTNIRGQQTSANKVCPDCHGNGLAGMNMASNDNALVCQQILSKLTQADIGNSLIVKKVSGGMSHGGGTVADPNAWKALFVNNAGVFF